MTFDALLRDLLQELARLERTPLLLDVDLAGITAAALRRQSPASEEGSGWAAIRNAFEASIDRALPDEAGGLTRPAESSPGLTEWLARRRDLLARIHSRAASVLLRRLEGRSTLEIAEELLLGPRLVRRILLDMREAGC